VDTIRISIGPKRLFPNGFFGNVNIYTKEIAIYHSNGNITIARQWQNRYKCTLAITTNPLSTQNSNVHFYIRKFLDKSGYESQKNNFLAPFSARREHVNACSRQFNWSVQHNSLAPAPQAQPMLLEPSMRSTTEPMSCFCLLALVRYTRARRAMAGRRARMDKAGVLP
jgi:hypothetical protein